MSYLDFRPFMANTTAEIVVQELREETALRLEVSCCFLILLQFAGLENLEPLFVHFVLGTIMYLRGQFRGDDGMVSVVLDWVFGRKSCVWAGLMWVLADGWDGIREWEGGEVVYGGFLSVLIRLFFRCANAAAAVCYDNSTTHSREQTS